MENKLKKLTNMSLVDYAVGGVRAICEPVDSHGYLTFIPPWFHSPPSVKDGHLYNLGGRVARIVAFSPLHKLYAVYDDSLDKLYGPENLLPIPVEAVRNLKAIPNSGINATELIQILKSLLDKAETSTSAIAAAILAGASCYHSPVATAWMVALAYERFIGRGHANICKWAKELLGRCTEAEIAELPPGLVELAGIKHLPNTETSIFDTPEFKRFAGIAPNESLDNIRETLSVERQAEAIKHFDAMVPALIDELETPIPENAFKSGQHVLLRCQLDRKFIILGKPWEFDGNGNYVIADNELKYGFMVHGFHLKATDRFSTPIEMLDIISSSHITNDYAVFKRFEMLRDYDCWVDESPIAQVIAAYIQATIFSRNSIKRSLLSEAKKGLSKLDKSEQTKLYAICPALRPGIKNKTIERFEDIQAEALNTIYRWVGTISEKVDPEDVSGKGNPSPEESPAKPSNAPRKKKPRRLRFDMREHLLHAIEWDLNSTQDSFKEATYSALNWLGDRLGTPLPHTWTEGGHEIELGGVRIEIESASTLFAFRMEHPDRTTAGRTWRLEIAIVKGTDKTPCRFSVRIATRDLGNIEKTTTGLPGIVSALFDSPGIMLGEFDCRHITDITSSTQFERWREQLQESRRYVIGITGEERGYTPRPEFMALVQHSRMLGRAATAYDRHMPNGLPKRGTMDIWFPGTEIPERIDLSDSDQTRRLIQRAANVRKEAHTPTFREIRDLIRDASKVTQPSEESVDPSTQQTEDKPPTPTQEIVEFGRIDELQQMLDAALAESAGYRKETASAKKQITELKIKLKSLEAHLNNATATGESANELPPIPETLASIGDWAACLEPRVVITNKARKAAEDVPDHESPGRIYAGLLALANEYWETKFTDDPDAQKRWEAKQAEIKLEWSGIGMAANNHRYMDEYTFIHDGKKYTMTMHLSGSNSRDRRKGIRIYVAIDEENRRVLIGHLPTHLTSTHS